MCPMLVCDMDTSTADAVRARIIRHDEGCWGWRGGHRPDTRYPEKPPRPVFRGRYAYRLVYEVLVGPIPLGLVIDHECENPSCVRPGVGHCVPRSIGENSRRGSHSNFVTLRTGVCKRGHSMHDAYTHHGRMSCRRCTLDRNARWKARRR